MGDVFRFRRLKWGEPKKFPVLDSLLAAEREAAEARRPDGGWANSLWLPVLGFVLAAVVVAVLL